MQWDFYGSQERSISLMGDAEESVKSFWGSKRTMLRCCYFSSYLAPFPLCLPSPLPCATYKIKSSKNQKYLFCLSVGSRKIMTALDSIS